MVGGGATGARIVRDDVECRASSQMGARSRLAIRYLPDEARSLFAGAGAVGRSPPATEAGWHGAQFLLPPGAKCAGGIMRLDGPTRRSRQLARGVGCPSNDPTDACHCPYVPAAGPAH